MRVSGRRLSRGHRLRRERGHALEGAVAGESQEGGGHRRLEASAQVSTARRPPRPTRLQNSSFGRFAINDCYGLFSVLFYAAGVLETRWVTA